MLQTLQQLLWYMPNCRMYHSYFHSWLVLLGLSLWFFFPTGNLVFGSSSRLDIIFKSLLLCNGSDLVPFISARAYASVSDLCHQHQQDCFVLYLNVLICKMSSLIGSRDDALLLHENPVHCFLSITGPAIYYSSLIKLSFIAISNIVCKMFVRTVLDLTVESRV